MIRLEEWETRQVEDVLEEWARIHVDAGRATRLSRWHLAEAIDRLDEILLLHHAREWRKADQAAPVKKCNVKAP